MRAPVADGYAQRRKYLGILRLSTRPVAERAPFDLAIAATNPKALVRRIRGTADLRGLYASL
jgi:hypothetical protein